MILGQNKRFHLTQWLKCSCKYLTYKEWKQFVFLVFQEFHNFVSTLPIRNGNLVVTGIVFDTFLVSTLPIRNGNFSSDTFTVLGFLGASACEYLTYKEWKPFLLLSRSVICIVGGYCEYLTYKEWKLQRSNLILYSLL